jgi:hypothetical protein
MWLGKLGKAEKDLHLHGYLQGVAFGAVAGLVFGQGHDRNWGLILVGSVFVICLVFSYFVHRRFLRAKSQEDASKSDVASLPNTRASHD